MGEKRDPRDLDVRVARLMGWQHLRKLGRTWYGCPPGSHEIPLPRYSLDAESIVIQWLQREGLEVTIIYPAAPDPLAYKCSVLLKRKDGTDPINGPWAYGENVPSIICLAALLYGRETGRDETQ